VYLVGGLIGRGGMGEVYRARDTRLGRDVAIKVIGSRHHRDAELLARAEREARLLAAINHPNIGAIYGVETAEITDAAGTTAVPALVLELVEGEALAARLRRAPPAVPEALRLARQIADALDAAHARGIVHRDLKPANIVVTDTGLVKVLDFGIAKVAEGQAAEDGQTETGTRLGIAIGTPGYMSPEQTRGQPIDARTDIWAFGCLLFEMLSGRRAFARATDSDSIAAVLEREPEWARLPAEVSPQVRGLLRACLEKDVRRRLARIAEARAVLEGETLPTAARPAPRRAPAWIWVAAAALLLVAAGAGLAWWGARDRPALVDPSEWTKLTSFPDSVTQPALSPDGRLLTFVRGPSTFMSPGQVYLKMLPDGEAVPLTEDAPLKMSPVFSPDGSRIAYSADGAGERWSTWVVETVRGKPRRWLPNASGLTWTGDGRLLFAEIVPGTVQHMRVVMSSEARTDARALYTPPDPLGMMHRAAMSPAGRWVLGVEMDAAGVWLPCRLIDSDDPAGVASRVVGPAPGRCTDVAWAPDGRTMFFSADVGDGFHLWRQRFPDGQPVQMTAGATSEAGVAIAPDGRSLVTSVGTRQRGVRIQRGTDERQLSGEGYTFWPLWTGDGRTLLYRRADGPVTGQAPTELWMMDLESGRASRLLPGLLVTQYDLAPDGRIVAAVRDPDGTNRVWIAWADGREPPRAIPGADGSSPRNCPDGDVLFLSGDARSLNLTRVAADGTRRRVVHQATITHVLGAVSPDGRWLSTLTGELTAASTDGSAAPVRLGLKGEVARLRWTPDGRRLLVQVQGSPASGFGDGTTYVVPLPPGSMLPPVPPGGFASVTDLASLPGVTTIPYADVAFGPAPDVYAYSSETVTRNLYRIPIR
jgi:Tol biopolymer transport system component/tRNA A-37 threonylcarbamoyl transferase component Bud32